MISEHIRKINEINEEIEILQEKKRILRKLHNNEESFNFIQRMEVIHKNSV